MSRRARQDHFGVFVGRRVLDQRRVGVTRAFGRGAVGLRLGDRGAGHFEVGLGAGVGVLGAGQFLARDRAGLFERFASVEVDPGALEVGLRGGELRDRTLFVGLARHDLGTETTVVGEVALDATHRASQLGLGFEQREPGVAVVDDHQNVAFLDRLGIDDRHLEYRSADRRRDLRDFDGGVGVVGRYEARSVERPVGADGQCAEHDDGGQDLEQRLALACGQGG